MNLPRLFLAFSLLLPVTMEAAQEVLENGSLKVVVDGSTGTISMEKAGKAYLMGGKVGGDAPFQRAEWVMLNEPLGASRALVLHYANQRRTQLAIFPGHPFLCLRHFIDNPSESDVTIDSLKLLEATVQLPTPLAGWKVFGSNPLLPLLQNTGSTSYAAIVSPENNEGLVAGWISTDRAHGAFEISVNKETISFSAISTYGNLRLKPQSTGIGEWLCLGWFDDARLGLEAYADMVASYHAIVLPDQPAGHALAFSDTELPKGSSFGNLSSFCAKELAPYGFNTLQIANIPILSSNALRGDLSPINEAAATYPMTTSMVDAAREITGHGLRTSIGITPFVIETQATSASNPLQEWLLAPQIAKSATKQKSIDEGKASLDLSHPAAQEHLRSLTRFLTRDQGIKQLKLFSLDALFGWTKSTNSAESSPLFHDAYMTSIEIFRQGLEVVRSESGRGNYLLGSARAQDPVTIAACYGLVDAMRVAPESELLWRNQAPLGPSNASRRWFFHDRVWHNDPGPMVLRAPLTVQQAQALASWHAVSGQLQLIQDLPVNLPPERLEILKRTLQQGNFTSRPVDVFEREVPRIWSLQSRSANPYRTVIALFNWTKEAEEFTVPMTRFELDPNEEYEVYEFWSNQRLPAIKGNLTMSVPGNSCVMLMARQRVNHPMVLSTAQNVLQGCIEIIEESWSKEKKSLSGSLRSFANDHCELRILLPDKGKSWADGRLELGEEDAAAGVRASMSREADLLRLRIESPVQRDIKWSVRW